MRSFAFVCLLLFSSYSLSSFADSEDLTSEKKTSRRKAICSVLLTGASGGLIWKVFGGPPSGTIQPLSNPKTFLSDALGVSPVGLNKLALLEEKDHLILPISGVRFAKNYVLNWQGKSFAEVAKEMGLESAPVLIPSHSLGVFQEDSDIMESFIRSVFMDKYWSELVRKLDPEQEKRQVFVEDQGLLLQAFLEKKVIKSSGDKVIVAHASMRLLYYVLMHNYMAIRNKVETDMIEKHFAEEAEMSGFLRMDLESDLLKTVVEFESFLQDLRNDENLNFLQVHTDLLSREQLKEMGYFSALQYRMRQLLFVAEKQLSEPFQKILRGKRVKNNFDAELIEPHWVDPERENQRKALTTSLERLPH